MWHALLPHQKQVWKDRAAQLKAEHKILHPNYEYQPRRPNEIKRRAKKGAKKEKDTPVLNAGQNDVGTIHALEYSGIPEDVPIAHGAAGPNNATQLGNGLAFDLPINPEFAPNGQYDNGFGYEPDGGFSNSFGNGDIKQESFAGDLNATQLGNGLVFDLPINPEFAPNGQYDNGFGHGLDADFSEHFGDGGIKQEGFAGDLNATQLGDGLAFDLPMNPEFVPNAQYDNGFGHGPDGDSPDQFGNGDMKQENFAGDLLQGLENEPWPF